MKLDSFNNPGIIAFSVMSVLDHAKKLNIASALLIPPIIFSRELLSHLGRKTTHTLGIESLVLEKFSCFSNFNDRYYDALPKGINAILLLNELEYIDVQNGSIELIRKLPYSNSLGNRAKKISDASENISTIVSSDFRNLYLNLRISV